VSETAFEKNESKKEKIETAFRNDETPKEKEEER